MVMVFLKVFVTHTEVFMGRGVMSGIFFNTPQEKNAVRVQ